MIKLYVNHFGWVMGLIRDEDNEVVGMRFTKHKVGAKPFKGDWNVCAETYDALYYIENELRCHCDKVTC